VIIVLDIHRQTNNHVGEKSGQYTHMMITRDLISQITLLVVSTFALIFLFIVFGTILDFVEAKFNIQINSKWRGYNIVMEMVCISIIVMFFILIVSFFLNN